LQEAPLPNAVESHPTPIRRRLWWLAGGLLLILAVGFCASMQRSGLFNNRLDTDAAIAEHEAAWRQRFRGGPVDRLAMLMLMRQYEGRCITEEAQWESVPMDQRLDRHIGPGRRPIGCTIVTRGPTLLHAFFWTIVFEPTSPDTLRVIEVRRQQETL
jgi:hypothetical protein